MSKQGYIAFDLGAESGRTMLAVLHKEGDTRVELQEVHRFANRILNLPSGLHWDITGLWANLLEGLKKAYKEAQTQQVKVVSLGVDTWGVDFGLIGKSGAMLGVPHAYRNPANFTAMKKTLARLGEENIYAATGIQPMFFNSLFQLMVQKEENPKTLKLARHLLNMPDLLHYFFTGKAVNEATICSTTQLVNPMTGQWSGKLLKRAGIPKKMLGKIVPAGTRIGKLRKDLAEELGVPRLEVIAPGGHDTASAVAAVPVNVRQTPEWAFLSSGTWSIMGMEMNEPVVTAEARKAGFTNERGVENKIRLLKNIAGLWLVQEIRRDLEKQGQVFDYAKLTELARQAEAFRTLVNPGHVPFQSPGNMQKKIADFAKKTGQPVPESPGQFVRTCLESLALIYQQTLASIEKLTGKRAAVLHIVGGGGKNGLLNQLTADAINRPVVVGPYEATACGNALTQAMGAGAIRDLHHLRMVVAESSNELQSCNPDAENVAAFESQKQRFEKLLRY